jgi:23S rRNA U2552 (ribose-2'-O)-methylase RlmE/FtsJ
VAVELSKSHPSDPKVLGVDLLEVKDIKGAGAIKGDLLEKDTRV